MVEPGRWADAPIVRASTSAAKWVTWWSPSATFIRTRCAGVFGERIARHPVCVAVRLATVPEHLDQRQRQRALGLVRIAGYRKVANLSKSIERGRSTENSSPRTPSVARVKSGATAVSEPPRIPPWLLPL